jgi:hypothetical protein
MTRRSQPAGPPPIVGRRRAGRAYDPFYEFERLARDDGKPYKPPEPKAELRLLELLGTKAALRVMTGLLVIVVVVVLALMVFKA